MNGKAIQAVYKYRLRENAIGGASFLAVIALVISVPVGISYFADSSGGINFSSFGMASGILFLVLGITSILEDLRFGIQGGVSRVTVLVGNLAAAAVLFLIIGLAEIIMINLACVLSSPQAQFSVTGFYQMLFHQTAQMEMSLWQYGENLLFNISSQLVLYTLGIFFALVFYRLSKIWRIVGGIALGGLCLVGVPYVGWKLAPYLADLAQWAFSGIWNWLTVALLGAALLLGVDYLLLRRTPIRGRK